MNREKWLSKNAASLLGKTIAVTGATGGLGKEICRDVLFLGGSLLLLNRSKEKTEFLISQLLQEFPQGKISFFPLDLQNGVSLKKAVSYLKENTPDILLHNAGIYDVPRFFCSTGLDNVFQVNFAAPYYLTKELLPALRAHRSHVAVVGSIAHTYSHADLNDPDFHLKKACHLAYGNSKRYLMYGFSQLFSRETEVSFSIGHPGITLTNISDHYPRGIFPLIKPFLKVFFMKPETAALSIVYALSHPLPNLTWAGPGFFQIWGKPKVRALTSCLPEERQAIFKSAEEICRKIQASI